VAYKQALQKEGREQMARDVISLTGEQTASEGFTDLRQIFMLLGYNMIQILMRRN
jgi:hypothetical protein